MSKSKKGTAPIAVAVTAEVTGPVAFANGIDAGEHIASVGFLAADIAARLRVTFGRAYDPATGFPAYRDLDAALEKAKVNGITRIELFKGMCKKFDAKYGATATAIKGDVDVERKRELMRVVGFNAFDFAHLSPQGKAALGKGNDARAKAVTEMSTMLNKFASNCYGDIVRADNRLNDRTRDGASKKKSVTEQVKSARVADLPAKVAKLVKDGHTVSAEIKNLAALIVRLKLATIKAK
jgi:hypothetical protein